MSEPYEFDVTLRVRKRVWVSGPYTRDAARDAVESLIAAGAISTLAKHDPTGRPIETILDNDFTIEDVAI